MSAPITHLEYTIGICRYTHIHVHIDIHIHTHTIRSNNR